MRTNRIFAYARTGKYGRASAHVRDLAISFILIAVLVGGTLFVSADSGGEASLRESAGVKGLSGLSGEDIIKSKTSPPEGGADYKGYIVKIADEAVARIDAKAMKNASKCIVGDRIALVDKPKDVLKFASAGDVEIIEPNYIYSSFAAPIADAIDPIYTNQNNYQWGVKYVNASVAWQLGYRGDDVNIAILDSGIVKGHEDLGGDKIIEEWNWIGGNSNTADDNMHGSVVGGIIAADTGNYRLGTTEGVGMAGIADKSNLIIHKVLDKSGYGDIGILYALYDVLHDGNRVDVVNMSLGGSGNSNILNGMIQDIAAKGTIIVAASGNNGDATDGTANEMNYPAGCDNVIGVGSIGKTGAVSPFSTKNSSVDVVAPGELMVGLQAGTTNGYYEAYGYNYYGNSPRDRLDGTSFAAPVVAAAAAIAKQRDKNIDAGAFLEALKHTSRDAGPQGYDVAYGYGILDIGNLVQYLQTSQVNVYFNANGGSVKTNSKTAWPGGKYGTLPTPTKNKKGFSGWYTSKKGGKKVTPDTIVSGNVTLYAHWQGGTTLSDMTASKGKLSPVFSHSKMHYKLTLMKGDATTRITAVKSSGSTSVKIKVGDGGYKTKSSVKVKLKKGGKTTVYIKVSKKGMKAKTYKIVVRRKK